MASEEVFVATETHRHGADTGGQAITFDTALWNGTVTDLIAAGSSSAVRLDAGSHRMR